MELERLFDVRYFNPDSARSMMLPDAQPGTTWEEGAFVNPFDPSVRWPEWEAELEQFEARWERAVRASWPCAHTKSCVWYLPVPLVIGCCV